MIWTERLRAIWRAWRYRLRVERQEIRFVLQYLSSQQTAIDIGAHKGAFTYWMSKAVGPGGRVIAFEPQPELAEYLRNMRDFFHHDQVTIVNAGLSSQNGQLTLQRPADRPSPGATLEEKPSWDGAGRRLMVPVVTLDDYLDQHGPRPVDFIKCDVEGHEMHVFRGAERVLREDRPILLFECETRHHHGPIQPVFEYLQSLGYAGQFYCGEQQLPVDKFIAEEYQHPDSQPYVNNFMFFPVAEPNGQIGADRPPVRRAVA